MEKRISIFNDVIGPVMRGPSSSHTAATWRMARVCLNILKEPLKAAVIEFDKEGVWAANYEEQGTVMGINGGLLGLDIIDDKMKHTTDLIKKKGIEIRYEINSFPTDHTNTVRFNLESINGKNVQVTAVSTGGGAFEIRRIDDFPVVIHGDYYETLIWVKDTEESFKKIQSIIPKEIEAKRSSNNKSTLINLKSSTAISEELLNQITTRIEFDNLVITEPVLPIISGKGVDIPFDTVQSFLEYAENEQLDLSDLGVIYEKCVSGLSQSELVNQMKHTVDIIHNSINQGLEGTDYEDRILPQQSHLIKEAQTEGKIPKLPIVSNTIAYVSAIMEAKSAMEAIVANPTAGSCGAVGGVIRAVAEDLKSNDDDVLKAYFAAGMIGVFFAKGPGFSAEEHGCQVECGASSGMAAAGIVQLMGGTTKQAVDAASMAIQNMIGLVCDPVADRVEVPCLGKNISAAMNALSSATMACAGFDAVIPLEEVIETVPKVSAMMPTCIKNTGKGGLAVTSKSIQIKEQLVKINTSH
jgi:L-serine dehydratase